MEHNQTDRSEVKLRVCPVFLLNTVCCKLYFDEKLLPAAMQIDI